MNFIKNYRSFLSTKWYEASRGGCRKGFGIFFSPRFYLFLEYPEVEATDKRRYENRPLIVTIQLLYKIGNNKTLHLSLGNTEYYF